MKWQWWHALLVLGGIYLLTKKKENPFVGAQASGTATTGTTPAPTSGFFGCNCGR